MTTLLLYSCNSLATQVRSGLFYCSRVKQTGPNMLNSNKILLNTLPFYNCNEPAISFKYNSSDCKKEYNDSKWNFFRKKDLHILHLNIKSLSPKIDEISFISKQSNVLKFQISESNLDSSFILYCERDTVDYRSVCDQNEPLKDGRWSYMLYQKNIIS